MTLFVPKTSFKRGEQTLVPKFAQNFEDDQANMADAHYVVRLRDGRRSRRFARSHACAARPRYHRLTDPSFI